MPTLLNTLLRRYYLYRQIFHIFLQHRVMTSILQATKPTAFN